jgi:F-type H+-transporting ATPase subunit gamma
MTARPAEIAARMHGVGQLGTIVGAMRAIAAARALQSRRMLPAIAAYAKVIAAAIGEALPLLPPDRAPPRRERRRARVVFCAEQGFVGGFNETILRAAEADPRPAALLLVGTRGARLAAERGLAVAWSCAMAAHPGSVPAVAARLADALYDRMPFDRVELLFPRWNLRQHGGAAGLAVERRWLLPLDPGQFPARRLRSPPLVQLALPALLESLAEEYVYAQLCEAAAHAFGAENEARVAAMARARGGIDDMLAQLVVEQRQVRQEEITAEVVELAMATLAAPP